jgi:glycerophosphoryl diester phosphodiesterase
MKSRIIIILSLYLLLTACEKIIYSVDNPYAGRPTSVLMHRGCGDNPDYLENTFAAAAYGLSVLDGIELDIQYSKDGTLWLDHDNHVYNCDGNLVDCFQEMTDEEIFDHAECDGVRVQSTLESVFALMATEYPESIISLDIKGQYCEIFNTPEVMRDMADAVLALVEKYNMKGQVIVESSSLPFLEVMDNQELVGQFLISFGDIDKAIADARVTDARGISLEYGVEELNAEVTDLIHNKGYALMLWTINEPNDIVDTWNSKPDFIQTDRADFYDYVP